MINTESYYTELFSTGREEMEKLLATALEKGGDYADLYFENTSYRDLMLRDGAVSSGGFHVDFGVGIRVLKGEKTGYAYSESTGMSAMTEAARAASAISAGCSGESEARQTFAFHAKPSPLADRYPMLQDWRGCQADAFVPFLMKLEETIRRRDHRVVKVLAMLSTSVSDVMMYNSHGELKYETRPMGVVATSVVFSQNGRIKNNQCNRSFRMGAEMLSDALLEEIASRVTANMDDRFAASRPKGGTMPVVMGAGPSGILLHEAMGHSFEADFNRKGQSIFSEKMGQKICAENITIVDDATIRGNRGALNFDDEGVPGQRTCMVENGIRTSYLHDRVRAGWYGVRPTGNGRRESFRYNPIPRMRATYMESGDSRPEDIIASVKKGIYVDEFTNGQVKIGEGDFTFYGINGYLIEDGKLTRPITDINIMGNGPQALADIVAVGNDSKVDNGAWTCGKCQSVPVMCGMPTVLVSNLTVGGDN